MKRPDAPRLIDVVEHANTVRRILQDATIDKFINDEVFRAAILYNLIVIGEAVASLTDDLKEKYTAVKWGDIKAFRNYVVHEYFDTSFSLVWKAASIETPKLRIEVLNIYKNEFPDLLQYLPTEED
jgi:uncharacterized protein with HEPN domain